MRASAASRCTCAPTRPTRPRLPPHTRPRAPPAPNPEAPLPRLLAAYDDAAGVTAAFNLNLLGRINRELGADFDLDAFAHAVRYDASERRVEMHLRAASPPEAQVPAAGLRVRFAPGETIWTESSHKYAAGEAREIGRRTGFGVEGGRWIDQQWAFAETLLIAA